jgi:hypothetical protein
MANQTATDYGVYPPRAVHIGTNRMHANIVATNTVSVSDNYYFFQLPPECLITGGAIKGSLPSGTSGQAVLKIGTLANDTLIATMTLSGGAVLATRLPIYSPITQSSSGTDGLVPIVVAVNAAPSATTSLSLYLLLEYTMPGNIN